MSLPYLSSEEYDERARQHYNAGEYDAALGVLHEGLRYYPDEADLLVGMGYVRFAREEYAWARAAFSDALAFEANHEDAMVGLGETLLKFGQHVDALRWFARVDAVALDDVELGLAIGRALYREGFYHEAREHFLAMTAGFPGVAELLAALAYSEHALGDDLGARRHLRQAVRLDSELHEARIYLSHLLYERGDLKGSLRELVRVPPAEHWDPLSLWRVIDLRCSLAGCAQDDLALAPWRARLAELDTDPDSVDHLLAEVEAAFEAGSSPLPADTEVHRVRTADGLVFSGTWTEIVRAMRDAAAGPDEPLSEYMQRAAGQVRRLTGRELCCDSEERFLRSSAEIGLLDIEA
jgi:tetratricopeptide (TPR) repeat protein